MKVRALRSDKEKTAAELRIYRAELDSRKDVANLLGQLSTYITLTKGDHIQSMSK